MSNKDSNKRRTMDWSDYLAISIFLGGLIWFFVGCSQVESNNDTSYLRCLRGAVASGSSTSMCD